MNDLLVFEFCPTVPSVVSSRRLIVLQALLFRLPLRNAIVPQIPEIKPDLLKQSELNLWGFRALKICG